MGIDSLRYFWTARSPEGTAVDLQRVIQRYQAAWKRPRVVLIGYSQGADVLPFILNRLLERTRSSIVATVALSLSTTATFEFHVRNWVGASGDRPTLPEVERLAPGPCCVSTARRTGTRCVRSSIRASLASCSCRGIIILTAITTGCPPSCSTR